MHAPLTTPTVKEILVMDAFERAQYSLGYIRKVVGRKKEGIK